MVTRGRAWWRATLRSKIWGRRCAAARCRAAAGCSLELVAPQELVHVDAVDAGGGRRLGDATVVALEQAGQVTALELLDRLLAGVLQRHVEVDGDDRAARAGLRRLAVARPAAALQLVDLDLAGGVEPAAVGG